MLSRTSFLRRTAVTVIAAGALTTLGVAPAAAHDEVQSMSPEQNAVLEAAPDEIELTFSAEIMDIGHQVLVTDSAGQSVTEGPLEQNGPMVSQPLADTGSQDGTYQVVWRVVSSDGHPIEGTYTYTVEGGEDTTAPTSSVSNTPAPSISDTPGDAAGNDSADGAAQAQEATAQDSSGQTILWVLGAAAVVLALIVVGVSRRASRREG